MRTNHPEIEAPSWEQLRSAFSCQGILPKKKDAGCQSFTKRRLGVHIAEYYRKRRGGGGGGGGNHSRIAVSGSADGEGDADAAGSGKSADPAGNEPFHFSRVALQASAAGPTVALGLGQGVEPLDAAATCRRRAGGLGREVGQAGTYGTNHGSASDCCMGARSRQ